MTASLRLCLVLHNHQPVGNFENVFEQAYQDSYLPFLDVFDQYADLRLALHTSGPLMEWLDQRHGEYLDRVAGLVAAGRIEIVGGPFYEPILTMIPSRDRVGQIREYTTWLRNRLGADIQGMWMPERVWEQSLTSDIVDAGIRYTLLDDFHFKNAGLDDEQLYGYYTSEDDGRLLSIFPGSEPLRYMIPFAEPQETINYLRGIAERRPGAVVVFGDDGEKFGTWPKTKQHVYANGWLWRFFDALVAARDWLHVTTPAEAIDSVAPQGTIYLPDGSYREMTEWALPAERQLEYEDIVREFQHDGRWPRIKRFVRGGFWRNFKVKYPEANEMYARMMMVSRRLADAEQQFERAANQQSEQPPGLTHELTPGLTRAPTTGESAGQHASQSDGASADSDPFKGARHSLYRAQCNCSYWHGAFGGIYLPHLRGAVYNQLIAADNLLDDALGKSGPRVEIAAEDYNFDARQEIRLTNDHLNCLVAPARGGQIYEFDVRSICHNLSATLTRRPESYHRKVAQGLNAESGGIASIHEHVIFKQEGLDQRLQYDKFPRKSLLDHFYDADASMADVAAGTAAERGDFVLGVYEARIRRGLGRVQVLMSRPGFVGTDPIQITKALTLEAGSSTLEITYLLEGVPAQRELHFGVEFNLAGLPAGLHDRYFHGPDRQHLGHLGTRLDLNEIADLGLIDQWLGIDVRWRANRPSRLWTFPVETVSQSEGGFELVHQSVVVHPHWMIRGDATGRWSVTMHLTADTTLAESRGARRMDAA